MQISFMEIRKIELSENVGGKYLKLLKILSRQCLYSFVSKMSVNLSSGCKGMLFYMQICWNDREPHSSWVLFGTNAVLQSITFKFKIWLMIFNSKVGTVLGILCTEEKRVTELPSCSPVNPKRFYTSIPSNRQG